MLNKNILIAFTASITISAIVANMLSEQADYLNTTFTLLVDYVIYFSTFGSLYYLDNRKKYLLESGKTDKSKLKQDLIKIIASLGIAEVVYTIMRWLLQYYFLTLNYDAYLASIVSQTISTIIYMIVINLSVKMTRLYKDEN
jgi:Na+-driven multidrug efflux pump